MFLLRPAPGALGHHTYTINAATRSGDTRQIEMSVTGMYDEEGAFVGVLAAFRDLTEMINLQLRLGELTSFSGIVGRDRRMLDVYEQIRNLAVADYPVHITGETGTGKELVAAAIHNESPRAGGPFVPVNCGALPEGLLESELFGHVKGAFSGAIRDKKGRFELADGGTLFLDEVSELPRHMQVKLLRVLQAGTFERVGGEKTISVNVRIISATNKDLRREMERQNFREDLYYRLSVVPIRIPALRERKNDIPLLCLPFPQAGRRTGTEGRPAFRRRPVADDGLRLAGKRARIAKRDPLCPGQVTRPQYRSRAPSTRNPADDMHEPEAGAGAPAHARVRCIGHAAGRRQQVQSGEAARSRPRHSLPVFRKTIW